MEPKVLIEKIYKAKGGDASAFGEIYTLLYQPLFKFVNFRVYDNEKTEDIVSTVFLKWFESLDRYEPTIKPLNYLYTLATRVIINEGVRKKSDTLPENVEEYIADTGKSIEDILNTNCDFERVKKIIDEELNELEKEIIYLKYIAEKENFEIEEITGKKENNIRQIEYRALNKIRSKVEKDEKEKTI